MDGFVTARKISTSAWKAGRSHYRTDEIESSWPSNSIRFLAPFLADESAVAVFGPGKLNYTMPYYLDYAKRVCEKAKQLDDKGLFACFSHPYIIISTCLIYYQK
jgi:hypothetical protein